MVRDAWNDLWLDCGVWPVCQHQIEGVVASCWAGDMLTQPMVFHDVRESLVVGYVDATMFETRYCPVPVGEIEFSSQDDGVGHNNPVKGLVKEVKTIVVCDVWTVVRSNM